MGSRQDRVEIIQNWNGDEVIKRAKQLAKHTAFEIGLVVEGDAKELAPKDTGRLMGSIHTVSGGGQRTRPKQISGISGFFNQLFKINDITAPADPNETFVGTNLEYAPYQEYGTMKTSAQPFLRPALDMAQGKVLQIVQVGAKKEFGEYLTPVNQWNQTNEGFTE